MNCYFKVKVFLFFQDVFYNKLKNNNKLCRLKIIQCNKTVIKTVTNGL